MANKLYSLARVTTATVGAGTITLSTVVSGYLTFALAGVLDGDIVSYGIKDGANSEVGTGTYTSAGTTLTRTVTKSTNSNAAISLSGTAEVFITPRAEDYIDPQNFLAGLGLANNGVAPTTDIDVSTGVAMDSLNAVPIKLSSALTKRLSVAWVVGTGQGMLATGVAVTDRTYHVFLIRRPDTGVVDIAADSSPTGTNIAANTNANYTQIRRIGSILRIGATIVAFTQFGNDFYLKVYGHDINNQNVGTTATTYPLASVPTGIVVQAKGVGFVFAAGAVSMANFYPIIVTDQTVAYGAFANVRDTSAGTGGSAQLSVLTDASAQIRARGASAGATIDWDTTGWTDTRGQ